MGISSSSLLDESKSNFVRGQAGATLKDFSPFYKHQYLVAFFSKVQDDVEQKKMGQTQLLKQREPPKPAEILYEENVLFFDDTRKWKERFVVVRANYSLECHDSYETFVKGVQPRYRLLPTGGTVLTSEDKYMVLVDKLCPDLNNVKEEFAPPMATVPGQFPVYLRLPYRRDSYFCFREEARRSRFISVLTDCIRHQNQDFLRKPACEVLAFRKAIRFLRQEKDLYLSWDMLIGSDVRVLSNLVMEKLLPTLQTEMLPRLKGRKTDRKKAWFATVEAAYILVQEQLLKGLSALKQECRAAAKQQEALIRSNMDQIISSQDFLAGKLRAVVTEPAERFCSEHVRPHLAPVLEELMGPVSAGFQETRALCERHMSQLCQDFQESRSADELKLALGQLRKTDLQGCYAHVDVLQDQLQELQSRYGFSNCPGLVHSTQIDMQQLMRNAVYTFEQLLLTTLTDNPAKPGSAMEKAKQRVLKQYDYDSSTVRKRIFQEALLDMTLPAIKKSLAPTCKPELQAFDQYIFADYSNFIQVENVYEDILLQTLECEVSKVVNEAASLKKHNLFLDGTDLRLTSQSSLSEGPTPPGSIPASPVKSAQSLTPTSPLGNGQLLAPEQGDTSGVTEKELVENGENQVTTETVNGGMHITPETEEITSSTAEAEKQVTPSTPEAVEIASSTAEADELVTPSTSVTEEITSSTAEADKQVTPSTPETEITSSTAEADKQVIPSTPEAQTVILPSPPESKTAIMPCETEKELTPSTAEIEQESKPDTAEVEKESTPSSGETEEGIPSLAQVEKEDTPIAAETKEDMPGATEAGEVAPAAAEPTDKDVICTAAAEQEEVVSVPETPAEPAAAATSLQSVEPLPSPSTDSAGAENPDMDGMVAASSSPPSAEAATGTDSPSVLVIDKAEENEDSNAVADPEEASTDAVTDPGAPSTGSSNAEGPKISVDSQEVGGDTGAMSAEGSEDDDAAWSTTDEVTESDVSLTSDPTAEGAGAVPETLDAGPVSEATETEASVDPVPTAEEAEGGAVTVGDEHAAEPTENALPTAVVSPTVSSPAEAKSAEEPGSVKEQAPDCIREIRDLVVEVIEVEEMVQHYPNSSSS
ncbi:protein Niban 1a isoform X1 [Anguilla rostrata]|uniref:protein Niban 1a isoform X1 n=1 Tax=Anguilla rostrata TaxID=7938 RepID=UPI0030D1BEE4